MKPALGEKVRIRSAKDILSTLDGKGTLGGVPFMPEMLALCGEERVVAHHAHKFCIENGDMGEFDDVVFLDDVRCDGSAHRGCQRECLLFWKTAWLETLEGGR